MGEAGGIAVLAVIYLLLFLFLGMRSIKRGHWTMFLLDIRSPIFRIDRDLTGGSSSRFSPRKAAGGLRAALTATEDVQSLLET